jgi:CheY-like chemotaxis protein
VPAADTVLTVNKAPGLPLNILLVEDIKMNRVLALKMLNLLGYSADTAENGQEAIATMKAKPYDLVFMDLYMPEMDGFTATSEIRRLEQNREIAGHPYICALTANVMPKDQQACLEAGMNDILTKPLRLDALRTALGKAMVEIRRRA